MPIIPLGGGKLGVSISVIVHSYNRPRMLGDALASVVAGRPDEIIVVDDGSTFDVAALASSHGARLLALPPMTVDERMVTFRQGGLINEALRGSTGEIIAYICDDDLHAARWYDELRAAFAERPRLGLVRGTWLQFAAGDTPTYTDPPCRLDTRQMTAGNFAHHRRLTDDHGVRWPVGVANCLDHLFLCACHAAGFSQFHAPWVGMAGWRREHPLANVHYSDGRNHTPEFRAVLEGGYLE